jgi:hypothetical protein
MTDRYPSARSRVLRGRSKLEFGDVPKPALEKVTDAKPKIVQ